MESKNDSQDNFLNIINSNARCIISTTSAWNKNVMHHFEITIDQAKDLILAKKIAIRFEVISNSSQETDGNHSNPIRLFCQLTEDMVKAIFEIGDDQNSNSVHHDNQPGTEANQKDLQQEPENENEHLEKNKLPDRVKKIQLPQLEYGYKWNVRGYKCGLCQKVFLSRACMSQHKKAHEIGGYPCAECGTVFWYKRNLANHLAAHQKKKQEPWWKCDKCEYECDTKEKVERHSKLHRRVVQHWCKQCNRVFVSPKYLQLHIKTVHLKEKSYFCNICWWSFSTEASAKQHKLRIHYPEKWAAVQKKRRKERENRGISAGNGA